MIYGIEDHKRKCFIFTYIQNFFGTICHSGVLVAAAAKINKIKSKIKKKRKSYMSRTGVQVVLQEKTILQNTGKRMDISSGKANNNNGIDNNID